MTRWLARLGRLQVPEPLLAALPIVLCMGVMAVPEFDHTGTARAFYAACYLFWVVPLSLIQRFLWRRRAPAWTGIPLLLIITYGASVSNNGLAQTLVVRWHLVPGYDLRALFSGLDGCWLALIAFCALHSLLHHRDALQQAQRREAQAESSARAAELRALQYQLNPHFLFNTLNSISSLVAAGRPGDATRMIARLADLLRATLERSDQSEVTLAEELSLTEHYLDIEKARLGSRLKVSLRVGPGLLQAQVPPLLLQPLVENAIRHGIALRPEGGTLSMDIMREDSRLVVNLQNDGAPRRSADGASRSTAIGLNNVRQRLETLYAGDHSMDIVMGAAGGCSVRLSLPLQLAACAEPCRA
jgi:two-component system, LytTR family, sensor histidine kinase AlgZ